MTLVAWVLAAPMAAAQPVPELFVYRAATAVNDVTNTVGALDQGRAAVMSRAEVGIRVDALFDDATGPAPAIVLNTNERSWRAVFERLDYDATGFRSWVGHIDGLDKSHVVITERRGVVAGLVTAGAFTYQIRTVSPGTAHLLERVDLDRLAMEKDPVPLGGAGRSRVGAEATGDGDNTVDVLMLYTPAARARLEGTAQIQALSAQVISDTNSAFARSGIAARVRLTAAHELSFTEAPLMESDLRSVRESAEARFLREAYHADIVQLLVLSPDLSACGVAFLFSNEAVDFDAYSVADVTCAPQYTPTHEMGHNFGSHHAPEDGAAGALFPYSYGLKDSGRGFRTIMAYACSDAPCPRVPIFSNPSLVENGGPAGSSFQNNARSISEAAPFVARFRSAPQTPGIAPPSPPLNLSAEVVGNNVTVSWTAGSSVGGAPSSYILQVGNAPATSNVFNATVGGATTASGFVPGGAYFWRVIALGPGGQSAPSPESQFMVGCAAPLAPANLSSSVSSGTVTLTWSEVSGTTPVSYVLEAGSAPTLANLLVTSVGSQPSLVTPAPPGTYYVRVRAQTACGTSGPSNERVIVVP
jgi:hypothetical protein